MDVSLQEMVDAQREAETAERERIEDIKRKTKEATRAIDKWNRESSKIIREIEKQGEVEMEPFRQARLFGALDTANRAFGPRAGGMMSLGLGGQLGRRRRRRRRNMSRIRSMSRNRNRSRNRRGNRSRKRRRSGDRSRSRKRKKKPVEGVDQEDGDTNNQNNRVKGRRNDNEKNTSNSATPCRTHPHRLDADAVNERSVVTTVSVPRWPSATNNEWRRHYSQWYRYYYGERPLEHREHQQLLQRRARSSLNAREIHPSVNRSVNGVGYGTISPYEYGAVSGLNRISTTQVTASSAAAVAPTAATYRIRERPSREQVVDGGRRTGDEGRLRDVRR